MILRNASFALGRASRSKGRLVWLACLLALGLGAQEPAVKPVTGGVAALIRLLRQPYKHLYDGATRDGERYQGLAARAQQRVQELRQRRVSEAEVLAVAQLAWLCQRQADNHQRLLQALNLADQAKARQAMADILFLEGESRRFDNGDFGREWLTFQEVEVLERLGQRPRRGEPGVLPFHRSLWSPLGGDAAKPGGGR